MKTNSKLNTIRKDNKLLSEKIDLNNQKTAELLTTIRNYHRSINAYLLSQKSKHLQLKQSILNESLYDEYIQLNNNYINNYSQYLKLHNMLDVSIKEQKIKRDNITEKNQMLKMKYNLINQYISKAQSILQKFNMKVIKNKKYIIEPRKHYMDKYNELSFQNELISKFKDLYVIKKDESLNLQKELMKIQRELKVLKDSNKNNSQIKLSQIHLDRKNSHLSSSFSIGSVDDDYFNNYIGDIETQSPKFLKKIKKKSSLDFSFEKKLDFNALDNKRKSFFKSFNNKNRKSFISVYKEVKNNKSGVINVSNGLNIELTKKKENKDSIISSVKDDFDNNNNRSTICLLQMELSDYVKKQKLLIEQKNMIVKRIEEEKKNIENLKSKLKNMDLNSKQEKSEGKGNEMIEQIKKSFD